MPILIPLTKENKLEATQISSSRGLGMLKKVGPLGGILYNFNGYIYESFR